MTPSRDEWVETQVKTALKDLRRQWGGTPSAARPIISTHTVSGVSRHPCGTLRPNALTHVNMGQISQQHVQVYNGTASVVRSVRRSLPGGFSPSSAQHHRPGGAT